jgi:hypothetical protein
MFHLDDSRSVLTTNEIIQAKWISSGPWLPGLNDSRRDFPLESLPCATYLKFHRPIHSTHFLLEKQQIVGQASKEDEEKEKNIL